jgi:hypothetical protein
MFCSHVPVRVAIHLPVLVPVSIPPRVSVGVRTTNPVGTVQGVTCHRCHHTVMCVPVRASAISYGLVSFLLLLAQWSTVPGTCIPQKVTSRPIASRASLPNLDPTMVTVWGFATGRPKWAKMAKIKSCSKTLIHSYVLGDHLNPRGKKELFQSGPYSSGYGYRFTVIFKIVVKLR